MTIRVKTSEGPVVVGGPSEPGVTAAELTAQTDAALAALVDSAPGTLDTLNELAAAIGDDANYAASVTTALAAKANTADLGTAAAADTGDFDPAGSAAAAEAAANAYTDSATSPLLSTAAAPELIRDTMGTALVAGTNVTITPNDGSDTITIAASGGGGSAGVWTKIATTRLTVATAQVDFTSLSGYTALRLRIQGGSFTGSPASQEASIYCRFNSVSTTTYQWVRNVGYNNSAAFAAFNSAATDATQIVLGSLPMNATAGSPTKLGGGVWHFDNSNIAASRTVVGTNTYQQRGFDRVFVEVIGGNAEATAVISTLSLLTAGSDLFDIGTTFILEGTTE